MGDFSVTGAFTNATTSPVAGTAEDALPVNRGREYVFIQNLEDAGGDDLWVDFGQDAVAGSPAIRVPPLGSLEFSANGTGFVPSGRVSVISGGTSTAYTVKEY